MPTCEGGNCIVRGPTMVLVNDFYMDSTEVTVAHYAEFLTAKGEDTSGQPAACAWNASYDPDPDESSDELVRPQTGVDWCDARAFCEWADKRLCGSMGGGPIAEADVNDLSKSEWFRGCGGPGGDTHPSIDGTYETCNDDTGDLMAAGSTCEGSYAGLFDMQGNAAEWIDSCASEDGAGDTCMTMGGSYTGTGQGYCNQATEFGQFLRADRYMPVGFRCCGQ
jgi:formylglycine-generating enzyme required for sulfatase activity